MGVIIKDVNDLAGKLHPDSVGILGLPFDENSSFMLGPAMAPPAIREALHCDSANLCLENGTDFRENKRWLELGDLDLSDRSSAFDRIESAISTLLSDGGRVVSLGGDHSVTLPVLRAYARKYPKLNVLQLDAHPDLYDELDGNRYSHATPMLRALEEKLMVRLMQVGIRAATPQQLKRAEEHGVETVLMSHWLRDTPLDFNGPVYLTLDIDCLDPAFAPGVSHHTPGGFSTREVLDIIEGLDIDLVGADIVELNPKRDLQGITAMVAAKLLKEILGRILA